MSPSGKDIDRVNELKARGRTKSQILALDPLLEEAVTTVFAEEVSDDPMVDLSGIAGSGAYSDPLDLGRVTF